MPIEFPPPRAPEQRAHSIDCKCERCLCPFDQSRRTGHGLLGLVFACGLFWLAMLIVASQLHR